MKRRVRAEGGGERKRKEEWKKGKGTSKKKGESWKRWEEEKVREKERTKERKSRESIRIPLPNLLPRFNIKYAANSLSRQYWPTFVRLEDIAAQKKLSRVREKVSCEYWMKDETLGEAYTKIYDEKQPPYDGEGEKALIFFF